LSAVRKLLARNGRNVDPRPRLQQNAERSAERHGSRSVIRHAKYLAFNPFGSGQSRAFSIAPGLSAGGKRMLQSEQTWGGGQLYDPMEFNTPEEIDDFVSAMEQMEPDQSLQMETPLRARAVEDSPRPLMRFCPLCDQWRSVYGDQTVCSRCSTPCEVTQDAMSKLPEGCNSGLMGM
jgi:hypothetical protein